jgi:hypothetical protein
MGLGTKILARSLRGGGITGIQSKLARNTIMVGSQDSWTGTFEQMRGAQFSPLSCPPLDCGQQGISWHNN